MDPVEEARLLHFNSGRRGAQEPASDGNYEYGNRHEAQKSHTPLTPLRRTRRLLSTLAIAAGLVLLAFGSYRVTLGAVKTTVLCIPGYSPLKISGPCTPVTIPLADLEIATSNKNRFYAQMSRWVPQAPPVFHGDHASLCINEGRATRQWKYCLPISGRTDEPYCVGANRQDLLSPQTKDTLCFASVLHMLLVDVYELLRDNGASPALLYGSLLGAVRNGSIVPFTEDADLGYKPADTDYTMEGLSEILITRGYHLFVDGIWRVCVAPTHPLASRLYDPHHVLAADPVKSNIPYVDLYTMKQNEDGSGWLVDTIWNDRTIPNGKMDPYSQVNVNGIPFDTVADPIDFLVNEYGEEYMVPLARPSGR